MACAYACAACGLSTFGEKSLKSGGVTKRTLMRYITMKEKIESLCDWARERGVPANQAVYSVFRAVLP